ncbi:GPR1/FUN34/yaaH family-domain-containing protein [Scheffersomyces xylosifermentans]|uniref:GPR1/FUN34/yaaH family-domain-containing protein n=1 Tax=Scheffersomyces xylosifermentans TaxID=1304137 RepID=UPI00315DD583
MSSINSSESLNDGKASVSHESLPYRTITYSGEGDEYVIIDNRKYLRHELMTAFAGAYNVNIAPPPTHQIGNAAAFGLAAFSLPTFALGCFNAHVKDIMVPNVILSLCMFYGGIGQMLAGFWEMYVGNTFAATTFVSYGAWWFSYGAILTPNFGILAAYAEAPEQAYNAIGFFLLGWAIFSFMCLLCVLKSTWAFIGLFQTLVLSFTLSAVAYMDNLNETYVRASGIISIFTAAFGWYLMWCATANSTNSYIGWYPFHVPVYGGKK